MTRGLASISLSANGRELATLSRHFTLNLSNDAVVNVRDDVLHVRGAGTLTLAGDAQPTGVLTVESASWLDCRWLALPPAGTEEAPTPLAIVFPEGALVIAGERLGDQSPAQVSSEGRRLHIALEDAWIAAGDFHNTLAAVADAMMKGVKATPPMREAPLGWMSWDELRFGLSQEDVLENARVLAERFADGRAVVLIDDGWQRAAGDWEPNARFGDGMAWLTAQIHELGLKAGIWIAPFLVAEASPVARAHHDWLLRDERGETLLPDSQWAGRCGTLDPTLPEVRAWLECLGRRLASWGFDYVKMDFLHHAMTGVAADATAKRVRSFRESIEALRVMLGPRIPVMGCGAPLVASRGLFDAVRIGNDSVTDWALLRGPLTNAGVRQPLHRRWWWNDPDNVVLRPPMTLEQARSWATTVAMTGGSVFLGDDLRHLPEDRWEIAQRLWPPADISARSLGLNAPPEDTSLPLGDGWVVKIERAWGHWWVVALQNHSASPQRRSLKWSDVGIADGTDCHVWELWSDDWRRVARGKVNIDLQPTSCQVLCLTPVSDRPQIIGNTRHAVVGAVGLADVRWSEEERALRISPTEMLPQSAVCLTLAVPDGFTAIRVAGAGAVREATAAGSDVIQLDLLGQGDLTVFFTGD
jgi:alpha-galactosidase